jgi:MFS family permease
MRKQVASGPSVYPPVTTIAGVRVSLSTQTPQGETTAGVKLAVLVAALGYFVDIYDLILFTIVRVPSLKDLGVPPEQLLDTGVMLLNAQNTGMVLGGILWGVLGDKRGRLSVLFGSIILYSTCNIANGFIHDTTSYAVLRFLAGVGLAGELGAGVTLVSEIMGRISRGWGSTIIGAVGMLGGVTAGLVGDLTSWRTAFFIGGGLGVILLGLRVGVRESLMFKKAQSEGVVRGSLWTLFATRDRAIRYLALIALALPIWYVVGILITFSPEVCRSLHLDGVPSVGRATMLLYFGLLVGNVASGALSQRLQSRKRVLILFLCLVVVGVIAYFFVASTTLTAFYVECVAVGFAIGYWSLFVLATSEQFGTNVRATATTTAPNFVRGAIVPMNYAFQFLKAPLGVPGSAITVGAVVIVMAFISLWGLEETYGKDLDFVDS